METTNLAVMSPEWVGQLYEAAARGSDDLCRRLVEQIPPEQSALIRELTELVETCQFEKIMGLTRSQN